MSANLEAGRAAASLPVRAVLAELGAALADSRPRAVVLVAPPGSGKTTLVPPWLLDSGLVPKGEMLVLQPRRVAARSVARFIAAERGEALGRTVGFQVRFEQMVSAETRIRVVTEGILTARLQSDPELKGVAAVILDEFHERSIHADLALALLKEVTEVLREDLIVIVMSATLDAEPIARFLGGCAVIRAEGRVWPITTDFSANGIEPGARPRAIEEAMTAGVLDVVDRLDDGARDYGARDYGARDYGAQAGRGDVLGFLPGVRLIEGTRERLLQPLKGRGWDVVVLHGSLDAREQDLVLQPEPGARPRVVLATNIAETSLTIPRVRAVVDAGLSKTLRYDLAVASGRLETQRISRASADQRRGRAGRLGPGRALRLWTRFDDERLRAYDDPEIRRIDLARVVLELKAWGADVRSFGFFEAPDARALDDAERRLEVLGAIDAKGALTMRGAAMAALPTDPRVAAFLVGAQHSGADLKEAGLWGALLDAGEVSGDWNAVLPRLRALPHVVRAGQMLATKASSVPTRDKASGGDPRRATRSSTERLSGDDLLAGYADRVGARRDGDRYAMVGGRIGAITTAQSVPSDAGGGGRPSGPVGHAPAFLVALEVEAGRRGEAAVSNILAFAEVSREALERHRAYRVADELVWDGAARRVLAFRTTWFLDLALERKALPNQQRERSGEMVAERAALLLGEVFGGLSEGDETLLARVVTLARLMPELGLPDSRAGWLAAALPLMAQGLSSFDELVRRPALSLGEALTGVLGWEHERRLRELLPERIEVPSGSQLKVAYQLEGAPVLAVKVQEMFGLSVTPSVARGRLPLVLHLLSPAGRPLQVTADLASFWTRTWPAVRAEMRSRYPRHHWPEDPSLALPTVKTMTRKLTERDSDPK